MPDTRCALPGPATQCAEAAASLSVPLTPRRAGAALAAASRSAPRRERRPRRPDALTGERGHRVRVSVCRGLQAIAESLSVQSRGTSRGAKVLRFPGLKLKNQGEVVSPAVVDAVTSQRWVSWEVGKGSFKSGQDPASHFHFPGPCHFYASAARGRRAHPTRLHRESARPLRTPLAASGTGGPTAGPQTARSSAARGAQDPQARRWGWDVKGDQSQPRRVTHARAGRTTRRINGACICQPARGGWHSGKSGLARAEPPGSTTTDTDRYERGAGSRAQGPASRSALQAPLAAHARTRVSAHHPNSDPTHASAQLQTCRRRAATGWFPLPRCPLIRVLEAPALPRCPSLTTKDRGAGCRRLVPCSSALCAPARVLAHRLHRSSDPALACRVKSC